MGRIDTQKWVLLIDDNRSLLQVLTLQLTYNGFKVETAETAKDGLEKALKGSFDVIVLDMGLPDDSGLTVCHNLRKFGNIVPVLILSGDTSKRTVVSLLKSGADDYLEKPFYKAELLARINALIRRNQRLFASSVVDFGELHLDTQNNILQTDSQTLKLTAKETMLMFALMQQSPKIVSRTELFTRVWGISGKHASNRLDVYIKRLRQKLQVSNADITIETIYGKGYHLKKAKPGPVEPHTNESTS